MLIAAGSTTFRAAGSEPAVFLHFVLASSDESSTSVGSGSTNVTELLRTKPIPGLKPGPYEFTLVRVTFPARFPINPPHRRSGAAMYYVLSGTGMFTSDGRTVAKPAGTIHFEPYDLVHQWANPADVPLVLVQANISQEGVPAVIFVPQPNLNAPK
jgi:quercetin dioxygenase-like cupin family protein